MSGATATAIAVSAGTAVASKVATSALSGGGSGGGSGGPSLAAQQYAFYGPHVSTAPLSGEKAKAPQTMAAPQAVQGHAATAGNLRTTPSQSVGEQQADADFKDQWADRLHNYIDYNTRSLG